MAKKIIIVAVLLLFARPATFGQIRLENSILWEIFHVNEPANSSYIYGAIHIQDKRVFQFGDSLMICLKKCSHYAGEVVIDAKTANAIAKQALLPKNQSLKQLIGVQDYGKLKKYLRKHNSGMYTLFINRVKPMFALGILEQASLPKDYSQILDDYLQQEAKKNKMEVVGLETMQEQMNAIDKISLDMQVTMLKDALDSVDFKPSVVGNSLNDMLDKYLSQDIEALRIATEDTTMVGQIEFKEHLISNRNRIMTDRLIELMKSHKVFVGVGAAHLGGEDGIIKLLMAKGYRLRPVNSPFKNN